MKSLYADFLSKNTLSSGLKKPCRSKVSPVYNFSGLKQKILGISEFEREITFNIATSPEYISNMIDFNLETIEQFYQENPRKLDIHKFLKDNRYDRINEMIEYSFNLVGRPLHLLGCFQSDNLIERELHSKEENQRINILLIAINNYQKSFLYDYIKENLSIELFSYYFYSEKNEFEIDFDNLFNEMPYKLYMDYFRKI